MTNRSIFDGCRGAAAVPGAVRRAAACALAAPAAARTAIWGPPADSAGATSSEGSESDSDGDDDAEGLARTTTDVAGMTVAGLAERRRAQAIARNAAKGSGVRSRSQVL